MCFFVVDSWLSIAVTGVCVCLVRLHMLSELEHTFTELQKQREYFASSISQLPPHWSDRLEMTQNSFRAKEPILALRRALLSFGPQ